MEDQNKTREKFFTGRGNVSASAVCVKTKNVSRLKYRTKYYTTQLKRRYKMLDRERARGKPGQKKTCNCPLLLSVFIA